MQYIVKSWDEVDFSDLKMPMITIFKHPLDYPDKYVARVFDLNQPTNVLMLADTYNTLVSRIPNSMLRFIRDENDHPTIIETWI